MIDQARLDSLVDDIFVKSFKTVTVLNKSWRVSPFNIEKVIPEIEADLRREYESTAPYDHKIMGSLAKVAAAIKADGKISREVYQANQFAINYLARDLNTGDLPFNSCVVGVDKGHYSLPDGYYSQRILSNSEDSFGTEFQREYEDDKLSMLRIFDQREYDSLFVKTVDLKLLQERILTLDQIKPRELSDLGLSEIQNEETFALETLDPFNQAFGDYVSLNVFYFPDKSAVVLGFKDSPFVVAQQFHDCIEPRTLPVVDKNTHASLWEQEHSWMLDFYACQTINFSLIKTLHPTSDDVATYLVSPELASSVFPGMLKDYIRFKSAE